MSAWLELVPHTFCTGCGESWIEDIACRCPLGSEPSFITDTPAVHVHEPPTTWHDILKGPIVKCAYPPCTRKMRKAYATSDPFDRQWCTQAHKDFTLGIGDEDMVECARAGCTVLLRRSRSPRQWCSKEHRDLDEDITPR